MPLGINVLRNDGLAALGVAAASGAQFIRINVLCGVYVTDQGLIQGVAAELTRQRMLLRADHIGILADVRVKHAVPLAPRDLEGETEDVVLRGGANGVIVSGRSTGREPHVEDLRCVRAAAQGVSVLVGSGLTADNVRTFLPDVDGMIVGTSLRRHDVKGQPVDRTLVSELMARVHG